MRSYRNRRPWARSARHPHRAPRGRPEAPRRVASLGRNQDHRRPL